MNAVQEELFINAEETIGLKEFSQDVYVDTLEGSITLDNEDLNDAEQIRNDFGDGEMEKETAFIKVEEKAVVLEEINEGNGSLDSLEEGILMKAQRSSDVEQNQIDSDDAEKEKVACPFCGKILRRLNDHMRLFHRNKIFICSKPSCGKVFRTPRNLQSHQLTCFNMKKEFKCEFCLKEFHRKSNCTAHERRHRGTSLECLLCGRSFVDGTGLKRHFLRHHESQQPVFKSSCCGKYFKSREGRKKHQDKGCKRVAGEIKPEPAELQTFSDIRGDADDSIDSN